MHKLADYEAIGIVECWIVDYLGSGGVRHIGSPKQPPVSVCHLVEGEYRIEHCRGGDRIRSLLFPRSSLTATDIFAAAAMPD